MSNKVTMSVIHEVPTMVKNELARMSQTEQEAFVEEYKRRRKSLAAAYLFMLLFGLHHIYLKKTGIQFLFWGTCILGVGVIWWFVDIFRVPGMVRNYNKDVAVDVLRSLRIVTR